MRNIRSSTLSFLVQKLRISNKEALHLITNGHLTINGKKASPKQSILPTDEVLLDSVPLQVPEKLFYVLYNKPPGIESTLNETVQGNLREALADLPRLFPVGRLDKDSEGLLFLTNDGDLYNKIAHSKQGQEKEYEVEVDKELSDDFIYRMSNGIEILGQKTRPAKVNKTGNQSFTIVLTQGLNRQIRRMCHKGGYKVIRLKRTRIAHLLLRNIEKGEWRFLRQDELDRLSLF